MKIIFESGRVIERDILGMVRGLTDGFKRPIEIQMSYTELFTLIRERNKDAYLASLINCLQEEKGKITITHMKEVIKDKLIDARHKFYGETGREPKVLLMNYYTHRTLLNEIKPNTHYTCEDSITEKFMDIEIALRKHDTRDKIFFKYV